MRVERPNNLPGAFWTPREAYLLAAVSLAVGAAVGYLIRASAPSAPLVPAPAAAQASEPFTPAASPSAAALEVTAAPLESALQSDPKNVDLLIQLANLYYDKQVYAQAIEYYRRALELRPQDVGARTDLGTAYWYSGFPEKAVAEYKKSLSIDPTHPQTLFNLGVVYKEGLKDPARAISTWEKLLKLNPQYPEKDRIERLIESARQQAAPASRP